MGIFNPFQGTKLPPGSCDISRPSGPGTISFINLEGTCAGGLPQYVARLSGAGSYAMASSPFYSTSNAPNPSDGTDAYITVSFWMLWDGTLLTESPFSFTNGYGLLMSPSGNQATLAFAQSGSTGSPSTPFSANTWIFVTAMFDNTNPNSMLYINGVFQQGASGGGSALPANNQFYLGGYGGGAKQSHPFTGSLSNFQIYNTSIVGADGSHPETVNSLYDRGIGGAPSDLVQLAGW